MLAVVDQHRHFPIGNFSSALNDTYSKALSEIFFINLMDPDGVAYGVEELKISDACQNNVNY